MRRRGDKTRRSELLSTPIVEDIGREALDRLFSFAYEELRRLASSIKRNDPNAIVNPTTLVHEAWLKLAKSPPFASYSTLHFKRIAGRAMRQLLVESARRRLAQKRGGGLQGSVPAVAFNDAQVLSTTNDGDVLRIDAALQELARLNPRQAQMVESRFFGGLEVSEIAELLQISEITVQRDWRLAKAWLGRELGAAG